MPERSALGEFEMLTLAAVLRLGDGAYGAAVFGELQRSGRSAAMGAVYTTLTRLEARGLLESKTGQPTPVRGGRRTKVYHLTEAGRRQLSVAVGRLGALLAGTSLDPGWVAP